MGINIELNGHILVHLNVKLFDAVFTEDSENATTGELSRNLNHIVLRHPLVSGAGRNTTLCWQYSNNSSC